MVKRSFVCILHQLQQIFKVQEIYIYILVIAVLFLLVILNNRRNQTRIKKRRHRNFKENYLRKKDEIEVENEVAK